MREFRRCEGEVGARLVAHSLHTPVILSRRSRVVAKRRSGAERSKDPCLQPGWAAAVDFPPPFPGFGLGVLRPSYGAPLLRSYAPPAAQDDSELPVEKAYRYLNAEISFRRARCLLRRHGYRRCRAVAAAVDLRHARLSLHLADGRRRQRRHRIVRWNSLRVRSHKRHSGMALRHGSRRREGAVPRRAASDRRHDRRSERYRRRRASLLFRCKDGRGALEGSVRPRRGDDTAPRLRPHRGGIGGR